MKLSVKEVLSSLNVERVCWTGGSCPPIGYKDLRFKKLRSAYFREQLLECQGLGLWKCAGTSCMERAHIFWNRASFDAWATIRDANRSLIVQGYKQTDYRHNY